VTSFRQAGNTIEWIITQPVTRPDGSVSGVLIGNLNPTSLSGVLNPQMPAGSKVIVVDPQQRLVYDTDGMRTARDGGDLLAAGSLHTVIDNPAIRAAVSSREPGIARYTDNEGREVVAGYDVVNGLNWVLAVQTDFNAVLAPVVAVRNRAILIILVGGLLVVAAAVWFAWRTTRPVSRLTRASLAAAQGDLTARVDPGGPARSFSSARRSTRRWAPARRSWNRSRQPASRSTRRPLSCPRPRTSWR
jgi:methyl-accepting chemotaxis protein